VSGAVAVVLKGYPRLSETFIANEIRALEERGMDVRIVSLRHPTDPSRHPVHDEIMAPVLYLPEYLHHEPARVWRAWRAARRLPGFARAARIFRRDLRRDFSRNRVRRFGQAVVLAHELGPDIERLHAHFAHTPASVTRYASVMRDLPWSVSAHAKDIWTSPDWELAEKLADCEWLTTCSAAARDYLAALASDAEKISLIYHGLDPARFPDGPMRRPPRNGGDDADPLMILSVGRAVEKKGLDVLIDALAGLPDSLHWRLAHVGGGPLLDALKRRAEASGISERVTWHGPLSQADVLKCYRAADLFVLPCRIAGDGDRDGLPNVLLEAGSQGLACVATRVSAIPELIVDGRTGLLVAPDSAAALAAAIEELARNPVRRLRLGQEAGKTVRDEFRFDDAIDRLAERFGLDATAGNEIPCALPSMRR